jgi:hypothetical protein
MLLMERKNCQTYVKLYKEDSHRLQERQYLIYWEYICKLQKLYNFTIHNLAEGHPDNISSRFTDKLFPLGKDMKDAMTDEHL